jgi:hypothetical protein
MHALAAERSAECLGVLLFGEHEPGSIGRRETPYARDGRRQFALVAEFPQRVEILVDALLLLDATKCGCVCSAPRRMRRLDATGNAARRLF